MRKGRGIYIEQPPDRWLRIGTAVVNQDRSLTVQLDAMPPSGVFHIAGPRGELPRGKRGRV